MKKNMFWLAAAVALVVSVSVILWRFSYDATPPRDGDTTTDVNTLSKPLQFSWREGMAQAYQLTIDSSMRMAMPAAMASASNSAANVVPNTTAAKATPSGAGANTIDVRMQASLHMHTLVPSVTGDAHVGMQLSDIELLVAGEPDPATNAALAQPFRVQFTKGGVPQAFEFPADVSADHRQMIENTLRLFQVTLDDEKPPHRTTWVAQEQHASGHYVAHYSHRYSNNNEPHSAEHTLIKSKHKFVAESSQHAEIHSEESLQVLPKYDWLTAMDVDETLTTHTKAGAVVTVHNNATLMLLSSEMASNKQPWDFKASAPNKDSVVATAPALSFDEARRRFLSELSELDAAKQGRMLWVHRLRDLLRMHDGMAGVLLEQLRTEELNDRTRADLYLALELADTLSTQHALGSVISDTNWSSRDAMRAIVALGGVNTPSANSLEVLWQTAENPIESGSRKRLASTATYALGSIGRTLKHADDPTYTQLRDRLLSGTVDNGNARQRATYIHAVGNTQDTSLAADVAALLDDREALVRRAAALSLGTIGADKQQGEQLLSRLQQESVHTVRSAIVEALATWEAPSDNAIASVRASITNEVDENTRFHMAHFLGEHLHSSPENRATLQNLLRVEPSKRVRQRIAEALAVEKAE